MVKLNDEFEEVIESSLEKTHKWLPTAMSPLADDNLESWWDVFWLFTEAEYEKAIQEYGSKYADGQTRLVTDGGPVEDTNETEHPGQENFEVPDAVFPTVGSTNGSVDVYVEQGRMRMREEGKTKASLGIANAQIEDATPIATLHAPISETGTDEVYAELAFADLKDLRELRDILSAAIEYREEQS